MTAVSNMKNLAVMPFYIAGALLFLGLTVLSFIAADSLHGHLFQARTLALVHIAALGWGTMLVFGAAYQLIPVIFERPLYSPRLAFASFVLLVVGSFCLVTAFWNSHTGWPMLTGGSL